jgi:enamine deaminase RidA (YjgF/YER057c/UK114 family)
MPDAAQKDAMNEAWMAWVDRSNLPTRTAVGADLTPGTMVEITIFAAK